MEINEKDYNSCYEAFKSKDNRFDGSFFVGIISTGVYCRPVCKAKLPKAENRKFFKTAAEAELPGIGPWSANYIAMRTLGYTDAFLETDYGVKKP